MFTVKCSQCGKYNTNVISDRSVQSDLNSVYSAVFAVLCTVLMSSLTGLFIMD